MDEVERGGGIGAGESCHEMRTEDTPQIESNGTPPWVIPIQSAGRAQEEALLGLGLLFPPP